MSNAASLERPLLAVCCTDIQDPNWRWLEPSLDDVCRFEFVRCVGQRFFDKAIRFLNLPRIRGCFRAVLIARRRNADVIVTYGPTLAAWCSLFRFLLSPKAIILAHTFNFAEPPNIIKRAVFSIAFRGVDRFVVFSNAEKSEYARKFGVPEDRFEFIHWGVEAPHSVDGTPIEHGDYICSIGGNARDYKTLIEAARRLPNLTFSLVVRPHNIAGLDPPENVRIRINLSRDECMNVLCHSSFMVLPLSSAVAACGHVTIVTAMHLGKAMVVTDSVGITDYVKDGETGLLVPPRNADQLVKALLKLWSDESLRNELGRNGQSFASRECTDEKIAQQFRAWILEKFGAGLRSSREMVDPKR